MNNMNFGVPNLRIKKEEKYPDQGVITFLPVEKEGGGRKMILNDKALELLNLTDASNQISFSFSGSRTFIVNTSGSIGTSGLKVGKTTQGFADKKHYSYIKTRQYGLTDADTLELFFVETEQKFNGNSVYELQMMNETEDQKITEDFKNSDAEVSNILDEEEQKEADEHGYETGMEMVVNEVNYVNPELMKDNLNA